MGRAVVLVVLLVLALAATWAASVGLGVSPLAGREPEVRSGSVGGTAVVGRGPRSGK
jgi:hypothetical protein